jgi:hypothetical protein
MQQNKISDLIDLMKDEGFKIKKAVPGEQPLVPRTGFEPVSPP